MTQTDAWARPSGQARPDQSQQPPGRPPSDPFGPAGGGPVLPPPAGPGWRPGGAAPAERRRPGWGAVSLASLAAAVLASGLTVGGVHLLDGDAPAATTTSQSQGTSSANPPLANPATDAVDWAAVAEAVSPSVVAIQVASQSGEGQGSGVILDAQGHVLTNNHVATGAGPGPDIRIVLSDGRTFDAVEVVGLDPTTDLAVLKIADPPSDLVPSTLGDSEGVEVGEPVMAVGNPLGLSDTVTTGIVSAVNRPVSTSGAQQQSPFSGGGAAVEPVVTNAIQTDAAVNPGNSGGALVDATGALVGIPSSIASTATGTGGQPGSIGVGFAIPVNEAKRIADELISTGMATHAWLGVSLQDGAATVDGVTRQGAQIAEVTAGTPAADAGLQSDDVVTAADGEPVSGAESLTAQVRERAPGDRVTLDVVRGGASQQVAVTLGTRKEG